MELPLPLLFLLLLLFLSFIRPSSWIGESDVLGLAAVCSKTAAGVTAHKGKHPRDSQGEIFDHVLRMVL